MVWPKSRFRFLGTFVRQSCASRAPAVLPPRSGRCSFLCVRWRKIYFPWVQFRLQPPTFYGFHPSESQNRARKCPKPPTAPFFGETNPPAAPVQGPYLGLRWRKTCFPWVQFHLQPPAFCGFATSDARKWAPSTRKRTPAPFGTTEHGARQFSLRAHGMLIGGQKLGFRGSNSTRNPPLFFVSLSECLFFFDCPSTRSLPGRLSP